MSRRTFLKVSGAASLVVLAPTGTSVAGAAELPTALTAAEEDCYLSVARAVAASPLNGVTDDVDWRLAAFREWFGVASDTARHAVKRILDETTKLPRWQDAQPQGRLAVLRRYRASGAGDAVDIVVDLVSAPMFVGTEPDRFWLRPAI